MKKILLLSCIFATGTVSAQYASDNFVPSKPTDTTVYFSTDDEGKKLPILWGLDTAWPDEWNMRRGVRYIGADNIGVARVSFQPWDVISSTTALNARLENNLKARLNLVKYIGEPGTVKLALNNDHGEVNTAYSNAATNAGAVLNYYRLIMSTMQSCKDKGWEIVSVAPLNEPDYTANHQGSKADFLAIAKKLKADCPDIRDGKVRLSGGNTLNCDEAYPWYTYLKQYLDEGNTHQLAGDFNHFADFYKTVRADGKYATGDELHNVMEAMVGAEYGMQCGIWWGTAELARGEFCRASFGDRLAYAENRAKWTAASVYRAPQGKVQAFVGTSERQAQPCSFRFVSKDRDVYYNGHGPQREYVVETPGGYGYQQGQTNAECVIDVTWGEDVAPVVDGTYAIMNKYSKKVMSVAGTVQNAAKVVQHSKTSAYQTLWNVNPVPADVNGDFSYYFITLASNPDMKLDDLDWSLEEGQPMIIYNGGKGNCEQWYLKYAGDGYFRIFCRHSNLCLEIATNSTNESTQIKQTSEKISGSLVDRQLWRLIPANAQCETEVPDAPGSLKATPQSASVKLEWNASASSDLASYTVLRSDAGKNDFNTIARGITSLSFIDNTVAAGKSYDYKVKAVDHSLNSSLPTSVVTCAPASANAMIAHLAFDNNFDDETANGFAAAAPAGAVPGFAAGRESGSNALKLVSNRFIQLPYQVANHENLTVGMWINVNGLASKQSVFDFGSDLDHRMSLTADASGKLTLSLNDGNGLQSIDGGYLSIGKWQHVALVISPDRAAVFVGGKLVAEAAAGLGAAMTDIAPVLNYIGCNQEKESKLNALVSDLRVYNYAVSDTDIPSVVMNGANSGVENITASSPVVAVEYFNMMGRRVETPVNGVYLVRRIHADGSVTTTKEVF